MGLSSLSYAGLSGTEAGITPLSLPANQPARQARLTVCSLELGHFIELDYSSDVMNRPLVLNLLIQPNRPRNHHQLSEDHVVLRQDFRSKKLVARAVVRTPPRGRLRHVRCCGPAAVSEFYCCFTGQNFGTVVL